MSLTVTYTIVCDFCGKKEPLQIYPYWPEAPAPIPHSYHRIGRFFSCKDCLDTALARLENTKRNPA